MIAKLDEFPYYIIFDNGKVVRLCHESRNGYYLKKREMACTKLTNGYLVVSLINKEGERKQLYLHRLVWEAFNGKIPSGHEIDHISTDRSDSNLSNLRLVYSHSENCNNPQSINAYRRANAPSMGKYDKERLIKARTKESYQAAKDVYKRILDERGECGVCLLMRTAHVGYPRAKRIINEITDIN